MDKQTLNTLIGLALGWKFKLIETKYGDYTEWEAPDVSGLHYTKELPDYCNCTNISAFEDLLRIFASNHIYFSIDRTVGKEYICTMKDKDDKQYTYKSSSLQMAICFTLLKTKGFIS